jgi:hypothetical protein
MTGALIGLKSADITLQNTWPYTLGSVGSETNDAGKVEAKWKASEVSRSEEGDILIIEVGIIGASLGKGMQEVKAGIEEPLELILAVLWWANGVGAG